MEVIYQCTAHFVANRDPNTHAPCSQFWVIVEFVATQVACEHATGATDLDSFHADFTNAYINISNVVLKIIPVDAVGDKAVLVNAHFDSTLGSPG